MLKVKVCGITRPDDARLACDLGADAIGFIFYPKSPRYISVAGAAGIVAHLPAEVTKVGVFVNETVETIRKTCAALALDLAQLHGDETTEYCVKLGLPYIKVFRVDHEFDVEVLRRWREETTPSPSMGCHSRTKKAGKPAGVSAGGQQQGHLVVAPGRVPVDQSDAGYQEPGLLPGRSDLLYKGFLLDTFQKGQYGGTGKTFNWELARRAKGYGPIILSGGLSPENVGEAVRSVAPDAVDVCSSVEASPGRKDDMKLRAFFNEIVRIRQTV
ncbi:MAG: hypothetical protein ACE5IY_00585 [bacterium]